MKIKEDLQNAYKYLIGFNHREVNSIMLMSAGIIVILIIPALVKEILYRYQTPMAPSEVQVLDSLFTIIEENRIQNSFHPGRKILRLNIPFNPNSAKAGLLDSVGLPPWVAKSIINYRSKGGKFKSKLDVKKIYGLSDSVYARIKSLILLPDSVSKLAYSSQWDLTKNQGRKQFQPKPKWAPFDLNLADTFQLDKVFGIGMKTAKRIAKYRDDLGGFLNYNQLHGVWSLDTIVIETLQEKSFIAPDFTPRKLKINLATEEELANHPFIRKNLAKYIFRYRKQHGSYIATKDLLNIKVMPTDIVEKLDPYLDFEKP